MPSAATSNDSERHWWVLLLAPLMPLYLVLVILFFAVGFIVSETGRRRRARKLRIAMRGSGRLCSWENIEAELSKGIGTILVNGPCMGWNDADVWWVRESVSAQALADGITIPALSLKEQGQAEFEARMNNPAFDRWCREKYFSESTGSARLVQSTHFHRDLTKTRQRIDKLKMIRPELESHEVATWMIDARGALRPENDTLEDDTNSSEVS